MAGNVGIGTTAPTATLTIGANTVVQSTNGIALGIGQASLEFVHATFNNGFGSKFYSVDSGSGVTSLRIATRADSTSWSDAITVIAGTTGNGNVGIGITDPAKKLHVSGGTGNVDNLVLQSAYNASGEGVAMQFNRSGGVLSRIRGIEEGGWNGGLLFEVCNGASSNPGYDGATNIAMKIATNGNVGIGTTAPVPHNGSNALIVKGGGGGRGIIEVWDGTAGKAVFQQVGGDTYVGSLDKGTGNGDLYLLVNGTGLNADTGAVLKANGNVGIGTTAPAYKLHVIGEIAVPSTIHLTNAGTNNAYISESWGINLNGGGQWPVQVRSASFSVGYALGGGTAYGDGNMFIAGNVGIGTTSPVTKLQVAASTNAVDVLRIGNTAGDSGSVQGVTHLAINHFNAGTNPSTRITAYQDGVSGWPGGMYFSTRSLNTDSAPVERMRITSGGNVGIGTTAPSHLLHVAGDVRIDTPDNPPQYNYFESNINYAYGEPGSQEIILGKPDIWLRINVDVPRLQRHRVMQKLTPELKSKIERDGGKIVTITFEHLKNARIFVPTQKPQK
jgi:hypothetical protein